MPKLSTEGKYSILFQFRGFYFIFPITGQGPYNYGSWSDVPGGKNPGLSGWTDSPQPRLSFPSPGLPTHFEPCVSQEGSCSFLLVEPGTLSTKSGSVSLLTCTPDPSHTHTQLQCPYARRYQLNCHPDRHSVARLKSHVLKILWNFHFDSFSPII